MHKKRKGKEGLRGGGQREGNGHLTIDCRENTNLTDTFHTCSTVEIHATHWKKEESGKTLPVGEKRKKGNRLWQEWNGYCRRQGWHFIKEDEGVPATHQVGGTRRPQNRRLALCSGKGIHSVSVQKCLFTGERKMFRSLRGGRHHSPRYILLPSSREEKTLSRPAKKRIEATKRKEKTGGEAGGEILSEITHIEGKRKIDTSRRFCGKQSRF